MCSSDLEHVEDIVGKVSWIAEWEELLVYPTELVLVQLPRRTVFEETFVPAGGGDMNKVLRDEHRDRTIVAALACQLNTAYQHTRDGVCGVEDAQYVCF